MKYWFWLIAFISLCNIKSNETITNTRFAVKQNLYKQDTNWISLFDGRTLQGWHTYGDANAASAWKVDDGMIRLDASKLDRDGNTINGGDLLTNNEYSNFDLKLQWKISKGGNSGVKFYVEEDTTKYDEAIGLEMQIVDNVNHPDGKHAKHRAGSLYDLIAPTAEVVKPYGEWNDAEIICNNGQLEFYLNGTKIVETTLWNDNWKKIITHSKYKRMKTGGHLKPAI